MILLKDYNFITYSGIRGIVLGVLPNDLYCVYTALKIPEPPFEVINITYSTAGFRWLNMSRDPYDTKFAYPPTLNFRVY